MGYYFDGVNYQWWDDNQNLGGADPHVAGTPHNLAEFATAFPLVCGQPTHNAIAAKAGLVYFINQNTIIGGKDGVDAYNQTTWTETSTKYLFLTPGKTLTIRAQGANPNVRLNHGIKIGSGSKSSGVRGVNWYQGGNLIILQNANLYGGKYESDGTIQLSDNAINNTLECAGNQFQGNGGIAGIQGTGCRLYNNLFGLTSNLTSCSPSDSDNLVVGISGTPTSFIASGSALRKPKGLVLLGSPTIGQIRITGPSGNWKMSRTKWADSTAPHILLTAPNVNPDLSSSATLESEEVHFRIMDQFGAPLAGIPAQLRSSGPDYFGSYDPWGGATIYSNADGDYVWTDTVNTGSANNMVVRSWGSSSSATIYLDRIFTLYINQRTFPGHQLAYPARVVKFTIPGRDMRNGVPTAGGGDFYTTITVPVALDFTPNSGSATVDIEECALGVSP